MLMRADIYRKLGGLNENIIFYGEEPEFGYRSQKHGYKTIYYSGAPIIHLGGQSSQQRPKTPDDVRLRRYAALQHETVGYAHSIWMSRVVLLAAYIKCALSSNKPFFTEAIQWEKKVIRYLKQKQTEERK